MLAGVLLASFNASAIPGFWQQGYGQGNTEYSVTEASGKDVYHQLHREPGPEWFLSAFSLSYPCR
jgi:hypothetical protein